MAVYAIKEEAINVVNSIDNKLMNMNATLDDISKRVNAFTQQEWISEAATNCKNAIDKHILDAKKYFMEVQTYLSSLNATIEQSFENERNRENIISNS